MHRQTGVNLSTVSGLPRWTRITEDPNAEHAESVLDLALHFVGDGLRE
jgi:hypothetical protein